MEKYPEHIYSNPIYYRTYNIVFKKKKGCSFLVCGGGGCGKSWGSIKMGEDLDPNFNINRIVFTAAEFIRLVKNEKLPPGSVIVFDETTGSEEGLDSRDALSIGNKRISNFMSMCRVLRLILFWIAPVKSTMDKRLRLFNNTGTFNFIRVNFKEKTSIASFKWNLIKGDSEKNWEVFPAIFDASGKRQIRIETLIIPKPNNEELLKVYEEKKINFVRKKIDDWEAQLSKEHPLKGVVGLDEVYVKAKNIIGKITGSKGQLSTELMMLELGVNERQARGLREKLYKEFPLKA